MSLKYRIATLVFVLEVLMVGTVLWQMQSRSLESGRAQLAESEAVILHLLGRLALAALVTGDFSAFQDLARGVPADSHARRVVLIDDAGRIVASTEAEWLGRPLPDLARGAQDYLLRQEVRGASGRLGEVVVQFSSAKLLASNRSQTLFGLRVALAGMVLIALAGIVAGFLLTRRLEHLQVAARAVARGNFDVRLDLQGRDEVAHLAQSFHGMTERIGEKVAALQASQRRVQLLLDATSEGICGVDREGRCVFINLAGARILGYCQPGELLGQSLEPMIGEAIASRGGEAPALPPGMVRRHDGQVLDVESVTYPVTDADRAVGTLITFRDVTESRRAEQSIRESEHRFRTIFEQAAVGVALVDTRTSRFLRINRHYCDLLGYTEAELLDGVTFRELTHPDDLQPDLEQMARLRAGEIHEFSMDKRYRHKNGAIVWVSLTVSRIRSEADASYHVAIVQDIGERKRAEEAAAAAQAERRYNEARFRDFANLAADWFWESDTESRFIFLSDNYEKQFGIPASDVLGRRREEYQADKTDIGSEAWQRHLATTAARQPFRDFEFEWLGPRGWYHLSLTGRPLFDDAGAFTGYRGVGRDVTALRAADRRLRALLDENHRLTRGLIDAQEEERRRIARELHDDMGQSLTAIQAEAQSLRLGWDESDASAHSSIAAIQKSTGHVYACMHAVMERLHPALVDELGLVEALRDLCAGWSSRHTGVELAVRCPAHIECASVQRIALFRIAQESLTNIARHAGECSARLCLAQADGVLAMQISDDGAGVNLAQRRRGLGLLSIAERAEGLGGEADFRSAPGGGLSVCVSLPAGGHG